MIKTSTLAVETGLVTALFDSSGAALYKERNWKLNLFVCLRAWPSSFMFQEQETYFSSDSTLRRFSSRHYKDSEVGEVNIQTLRTTQVFETLERKIFYLVNIIVLFLHFSLSICSFLIQVFRLALLAAGLNAYTSMSEVLIALTCQ